MNALMMDGEASRVEQPAWYAHVDEVKKTINDLVVNLEELGKAQTQQLTKVDFDVDIDSSYQTEVDKLNKKIGKLFASANGMVKTLSNPGVGTPEDLRVRKNIQMALAGELQDLSTKFRKKHKEFIKAVQRNNKNRDSTFDWKPPEGDDDDAEDDLGWSAHQLQQIDDMSQIIDDRDKEIQKIAQSISELAQLFRELSVLVIDSGTILDRIDYNMEQVVVNFEQAEEELQKTENIQKKGKSAYCILALMIMCIIMALILLIKKTA